MSMVDLNGYRSYTSSMQLTHFSLWWEAENLEDVFICKSRQLKVHNKHKQEFQQFPEIALGEGWEAAGFARCSLSAEK